ncbi:MAG: zf-HC2 domain-containing protein [Deltaproteobacteria bacterium]|nr:zf-HC2 domain-containing protein [Deltaproteobacteria bacterium]
MKCTEAQELITALVDNELSALERASIESHLQECATCQSAHRQEQALKREIRMAAAGMAVPAALREKILSGLHPTAEQEEAPKKWERLLWPARLAFRPAFVFALLLLLTLPIIHLMQPKKQSISLFALESHQKILQGTLAYIKEESEEKLKEQLLRSVEGRFAPMGYDLSMMGLRPVGGTVQEIGGRKILVVLYEGTAPALICYTFLGTERDLPADASLFVDPEKRVGFYTFSRDGVNGVMHREGTVICILVSRLPMGDLLALARSKAKPTPSF